MDLRRQSRLGPLILVEKLTEQGNLIGLAARADLGCPDATRRLAGLVGEHEDCHAALLLAGRADPVTG